MLCVWVCALVHIENVWLRGMYSVRNLYELINTSNGIVLKKKQVSYYIYILLNKKWELQMRMISFSWMSNENLVPSFDVSSARIHCSKKFSLVRTIFSVGGCGHLCCSWLGIVVFCVLNPKSSAMADREDNVYKAKLAEQAERYDGKFKSNLYLICI